MLYADWGSAAATPPTGKHGRSNNNYLTRVLKAGDNSNVSRHGSKFDASGLGEGGKCLEMKLHTVIKGNLKLIGI